MPPKKKGKGKGKGKKKGNGGKSPPGTADSTVSKGKGSKKKGKKKKVQEILPDDVVLPTAPEHLQKQGLIEFFHGETPHEQLATTELFRSYKYQAGHKPPSPRQAFLNVRNMHLKRFPQLILQRNLH